MKYFLWFWLTVVGKVYKIIFRRKRATKQAYKFLEDIEKKFGGTFNPATKRKIAVSYGIYHPMVCEAFTRLHGRDTNEDEKIRFIYYFICSSLFDDFTDHHLINNEQMHRISFNTENYIAGTFEEKVFLHAHRRIRDFVKNKKEYDAISYALFEAQIRSQKQYQSKLSEEDIREITFNKGGYSVLLCSFYLDLPPNPIEKDCWYQAGKLIQLTNDLYDIHKDLKDGITTLPNSMSDAATFEVFFIGEITKMKSHIKKLDITSKRKQIFSLSMAGIYAFGLIAIHRLKELQNRADGQLDLKSLSRQQLIIDMEKMNNLRLWLRFTYKNARLMKRTMWSKKVGETGFPVFEAKGYEKV